MKLLTATAVSLFLLSAASAYAEEAASASGSSASNAPPCSMTITRNGSRPSSEASAEHFTGSVRIDPLFHLNDPSHTSGSYVTFEPGARSAWHTDPLSQILIVTAGTGWIQQEGGEKREIKPGGRHLDSAGRQTLARGDGHHRDDPPRHSKRGGRQERRLDGESH
jgi:hypothetical protein